MSIPFSAILVNSIRTESLETTYKYLIDAGAVVVCPHPTSPDFLQKFSPRLMFQARYIECGCLFCYLYWIIIIDMFKFVPCSTAMFPLDADFPSFSCIFSSLGTTLGYDKRILL